MFLVVSVRRCNLLVVVSLLMVACVGCGSGPWKLDVDVACESLETSLKAWKAGETPVVLEQKSPKIIVGDVDWKAGKKLLEFKIRDSDSNEGTNLRKFVELTLQSESGQPIRVDAAYLISTRPVITVFRQESE